MVNQYAEPLNNFVNRALDNKGVKVLKQTKVVPILSRPAMSAPLKSQARKPR